MRRKHTTTIKILTVLAVAAAVYLAAHRIHRRPEQMPIQTDSGYRQVMGTLARIVVIAGSRTTAEKCIRAAFDELHAVDELMSTYKQNSEISSVNRSARKAPVPVGKQTFFVLQKALRFSKLSDGAFDVTTGPLRDLWKHAQKTNTLPTDAQLAAARSKVGYQKLILDSENRSVRFAVDGMKLDLGGIAKGYAIDRAVRAAENSGAYAAMVDVGGDIRCFTTPAGRKKEWSIGLQNPFTATEPPGRDKPMLILHLSGAAVATSGGYRRFYCVGGEKYSHIIDTHTGCAANSLSSATVITANATGADALATAVAVMGPQKGFELIEKLPQTEAILIGAEPPHTMTATSGAHKYIFPPPKTKAVPARP